MSLIRKTTHGLVAFLLAISPASGALSGEPVMTASLSPMATTAISNAAGTAVSGKNMTTRDGWPKLLYSREPHLHAALQKKIRDLGLARYAADRKLAVALVDITEPRHPRVATVNAHEMMYAASLPKIAILLGAYQKAEDGDLKIDGPTEKLLTDMIRRSSNSAATIMLERVGFDYVADLLQSDRYDLYDTEMNGGLWVGKPYAKAGAVKRDPLYNLSHGATPFEVARFYYLLATSRLVSPEASESMLEILADPAINHKFVAGLNSARPGSKIFRKSGTWRTYHADSAIVERDGRRYIAVAMANHPSGGKWLSQLIVAMDDLVFSPENVAHDHMENHNDTVELPNKSVAARRS
jgi:beta-lactamase class A